MYFIIREVFASGARNDLAFRECGN